VDNPLHAVDKGTTHAEDMLKLRCKWTVRGVGGFAIQSGVPSVGPVRTRTYLLYICTICGLLGPGHSLLSLRARLPGSSGPPLLPAAEPRPLEAILVAVCYANYWRTPTVVPRPLGGLCPEPILTTLRQG
jgi:hypothetical protein